MSPTILVAGATGNTGRSTTETLSRLLQAPGSSLRNHRILALTRSANSPAAQHLATLPGVQVIQQSWVEVTREWLQTHHVRSQGLYRITQQTHPIRRGVYLPSRALARGGRVRRADLNNLETAWDGQSTAPPTSKEVLGLAAPRRTPQQMLESLLEE